MTTMYKHVVDTPQSSLGKKRNETSVIGAEERKKRGRNMIFSQVAKVCLFKEFGSSPSTPNKQ